VTAKGEGGLNRVGVVSNRERAGAGEHRSIFCPKLRPPKAGVDKAGDRFLFCLRNGEEVEDSAV
jgi:hypothetical protein